MQGCKITPSEIKFCYSSPADEIDIPEGKAVIDFVGGSGPMAPIIADQQARPADARHGARQTHPRCSEEANCIGLTCLLSSYVAFLTSSLICCRRVSVPSSGLNDMLMSTKFFWRVSFVRCWIHDVRVPVEVTYKGGEGSHSFVASSCPAVPILADEQARPADVSRRASRTNPRRSKGKPSQTANIFSTSYGTVGFTFDCRQVKVDTPSASMYRLSSISSYHHIASKIAQRFWRPNIGSIWVLTKVLATQYRFHLGAHKVYTDHITKVVLSAPHTTKDIHLPTPHAPPVPQSSQLSAIIIAADYRCLQSSSQLTTIVIAADYTNYKLHYHSMLLLPVCLTSVWPAHEDLRADEGEASSVWSSTGIQRRGQTGDLRENPSTSSIVRHDSHELKAGGATPLGIEPCSPWWDESSLTTTPPRPPTCLRCAKPSLLADELAQFPAFLHVPLQTRRPSLTDLAKDSNYSLVRDSAECGSEHIFPEYLQFVGMELLCTHEVRGFLRPRGSVAFVLLRATAPKRAAREVTSRREICDCEYQAVKSAAGRLDYWTGCHLDPYVEVSRLFIKHFSSSGVSTTELTDFTRERGECFTTPAIVPLENIPQNARAHFIVNSLTHQLPSCRRRVCDVTLETEDKIRHDGNTARLARRSVEALEVRVTVARIAPTLLELGRGGPSHSKQKLEIPHIASACISGSVVPSSQRVVPLHRDEFVILSSIPPLCLRERPTFTHTTAFRNQRPCMSYQRCTSRHLPSEEIWAALNIEVLSEDEDVVEVRMERRQNERVGETGDPRENQSTNGIVRHDSHMRKSGVTRPGIEPGSLWWVASRLTAEPPWPLILIRLACLARENLNAEYICTRITWEPCRCCRILSGPIKNENAFSSREQPMAVCKLLVMCGSPPYPRGEHVVLPQEYGKCASAVILILAFSPKASKASSGRGVEAPALSGSCIDRCNR
ncbi:hypothetical protein PR048_027689 [Dryococelus australis]|uniref:Uncharacterized protein n=1 Tax=Dryococelus australis TaxID=614101 RepID=A0ABQ9GH65_9NEOP|nr:hypothetical protein PR048_027689 [Dryococelus australis]